MSQEQQQQQEPADEIRTPDEFRKELLISAGVFFGAFYFVAFIWSLARFGGDRAVLPALHLLSGIGLILMVSLRDPLRDTLEFHKFAVGVGLGCLLLALPALKAFDYMPPAAPACGMATSSSCIAGRK